MPAGNFTGFHIAVEECKKWKDLPSNTLARKLFKDHYPVWTTLESARNCVRRIRGVQGKRKCKKTEDLHRHVRYNHMDHCPPSAPDREWIPAVIRGSIIGIMNDVHIPYHEVLAINIAIEEFLKRGIDCLFINGDLMDGYQLSKFVRDPRKRRFCEEVKTVQQFFEYLNTKFPKAKKYWKLGNHDQFCEQYLFRNAPELMGVPGMEIEEMVNTRKYGVEVVKDNRTCKLGRLSAIHGHELGSGTSIPVNPARTLLLALYESAICGHWHKTSQDANTTLKEKLITTWSVGCLCGLHPEFRRINKWNHGYAIVEVDSRGDYDVTNRRIYKGKAR